MSVSGTISDVLFKKKSIFGGSFIRGKSVKEELKYENNNVYKAPEMWSIVSSAGETL